MRDLPDAAALRPDALPADLPAGLAPDQLPDAAESPALDLRPARVAPPSPEAGEITDKGYINQRAVLTRRADLVEFLHADVLDKTLITVHAAA